MQRAIAGFFYGEADYVAQLGLLSSVSKIAVAAGKASDWHVVPVDQGVKSASDDGVGDESIEDDWQKVERDYSPSQDAEGK